MRQSFKEKYWTTYITLKIGFPIVKIDSTIYAMKKVNKLH